MTSQERRKKHAELRAQMATEKEATHPYFTGTKSSQNVHELYTKVPKEMPKGTETSYPSSISGSFPSDLLSWRLNPVSTCDSPSDEEELYFSSEMCPTTKKSKEINQPASPHPIKFNIRSSIKTFTGREGVLQKLHETLQQRDSKRSQIVLLTGMGGIGKTETVRKYIEHYSELYYHLIWIDATNYSTALACFHTLGRDIGLREENLVEERIAGQTLEEYIYNSICTKPSLIIFDNISEINNTFLSLLLPKMLQQGLTLPTVILTSRSRNLYNVSTIQLEGFTHDECFSLLKQQLNFQEDKTFPNSVEYIANMSEGHPLILQQVISLVRKQNTAPGEPLSTFDSDLRSVSNQFYRDKKSLNILPADSSTGQSLLATFRYILNDLEFSSWEIQDGAILVNCLKKIALLSPGKIPIILLDSLSEEHSETYGTLRDSLRTLHDLNLITVDNNFCKMHRAIQAIVLITRPVNIVQPKLVQTVTLRFREFLELMPVAAEYAPDVLNIGVSFLVKTEMDECLEENRIKFLGILNSKLEEAGRDAVIYPNSGPIVRRVNSKISIDSTHEIRRDTESSVSIQLGCDPIKISQNIEDLLKTEQSLTKVKTDIEDLQIVEHVPPQVELERKQLDSVSDINVSEPSLNISIDTEDGDSRRSFMSNPQEGTFSGKRGQDLEELLTRHLSELRSYGDSFPFHTLIWKLLPRICAKMRSPDNVANELLTSSVLTQFQINNIKKQRLDWDKTNIIFGVVLKDEVVSALISALVTTENLFVLDLIEKHARRFDPKDPISC